MQSYLFDFFRIMQVHMCLIAFFFVNWLGVIRKERKFKKTFPGKINLNIFKRKDIFNKLLFATFHLDIHHVLNG